MPQHSGREIKQIEYSLVSSGTESDGRDGSELGQFFSPDEASASETDDTLTINARMIWPESDGRNYDGDDDFSSEDESERCRVNRAVFAQPVEQGIRLLEQVWKAIWDGIGCTLRKNENTATTGSIGIHVLAGMLTHMLKQESVGRTWTRAERDTLRTILEQPIDERSSCSVYEEVLFAYRSCDHCLLLPPKVRDRYLAPRTLIVNFDDITIRDVAMMVQVMSQLVDAILNATHENRRVAVLDRIIAAELSWGERWQISTQDSMRIGRLAAKLPDSFLDTKSQVSAMMRSCMSLGSRAEVEPERRAVAFR